MQIIEPRITKEQIRTRLREMAGEIDRYYACKSGDTDLVVLCALRGALMFTADMLQLLKTPVNAVDFLGVQSYHATTAGMLRWYLDLQVDIRHRDVLVLEDIVDTGTTVKATLETLKHHEPASLRVAAFLYKAAPLGERNCMPQIPTIHHVAFDVAPDEFVIGYGLDLDQRYRNLPYLGVVTNDE